MKLPHIQGLATCSTHVVHTLYVDTSVVEMVVPTETRLRQCVHVCVCACIHDNLQSTTLALTTAPSFIPCPAFMILGKPLVLLPLA